MAGAAVCCFHCHFSVFHIVCLGLFFLAVLISIQIRLQDGAAVLEASGLPGDKCDGWICLLVLGKTALIG